MSESSKTLTFVAVAAAVTLLAVFTWPKPPYTPVEGEIGQLMFAGWKDPLAAKSIEIRTLNEIERHVQSFTVADVNDRWVVSTSENYPADERKAVAPAVKQLMSLKILGIISKIPGDHATYGVVEPDENKIDRGSIGVVGKMVVVEDGDGKKLAQLIIGKRDESKSDSAAKGDRFFVRRAGEDPVYLVSFGGESDKDPFSSSLADWIDPNLLGAKDHSYDITRLSYRDYAIADSAAGVSVTHKSDAALAFDDRASEWSLKQLTNYKDNKPRPGKAPKGEDLDSLKLNDAKTALADLSIIEVERKPDSLLKLKDGQDFSADPDAVDSLAQKGMISLPLAKPTDLYSVGGDVTIGMKDGVEYTVHFGGSGIGLRGSQSSKSKKKSAGKGGSKTTEQVRWVTASARFNPDLVPKPMLDLIPAIKTPEGAKAPEQPTPAKTPAEPAKKPPAPNSAAPDPAAPNPKTPPATPAPATDGKSSGGPADARKLAYLHAADPPAAPATGGDDSKKNSADPAAKSGDAAPKTPAAPADAKKPADDKAGKGGEKNGDKKPESDIKRAEQERAADAERARIKKADDRKMKDYADTVKKGMQRATELNERLREWYFEISEDDYAKAYLTADKLFKKKDAPPGANPPPSPFDAPNGLQPPGHP